MLITRLISEDNFQTNNAILTFVLIPPMFYYVFIWMWIKEHLHKGNMIIYPIITLIGGYVFFPLIMLPSALENTQNESVTFLGFLTVLLFIPTLITLTIVSFFKGLKKDTSTTKPK